MTRRVSLVFPEVESTDEELLLIPFGFTINGTSDPDNLIGDCLVSTVLSETGEVLCTLRDRPPTCFGVLPMVSTAADDVDLTPKADWSSLTTNGTFTIRFFTGATQTNPADNTLVGGVIVTKKTTRRARRA